MKLVLARVAVALTTILQMWTHRFNASKGAAKLGWGCLPIVGLCFFCGLAQSAGQSAGLIAVAPTSTPQPTNTPAPTNTIAPTPTDEPTRTPRPLVYR